MTRQEKVWSVLLIGIITAIIISFFSGKWLEYMIALGVSSLIAAIIGAVTEDRVVLAGWVTFLIVVVVAFIFTIVFLDWSIFVTLFVVAILWGRINSDKVITKCH